MLGISVYVLLISFTTNKPEVARTKNRQCYRFESQCIQKFLANKELTQLLKEGEVVCVCVCVCVGGDKTMT